MIYVQAQTHDGPSLQGFSDEQRAVAHFHKFRAALTACAVPFTLAVVKQGQVIEQAEFDGD